MSPREPARGVVARPPKAARAPVKQAGRAAAALQAARSGRARSGSTTRAVRLGAKPQALRRLTVPARRAPSGLSGVAKALAAGAATRAVFGPAYRARGTGFMDTIVLPARGAIGSGSTEQDMRELFDAIGRLQEAALLPAVGDDLDAINVLVSRLPAALEVLRSRGYVHQRQLDGQVAQLATRWDQIYDNLAEALYARQGELVEAANRVLDLVDGLGQPNADRGTVETCWSAVQALQSQIEAAYRGLRGQYDGLAGELETVEAELARLVWTMDQVEAVPLTLLAGEAPVRAASVRWLRGSEEEGRPGLLFLTDQRVLFVHQQEVVTQRFLFITLKREVIRELEFEAPVRTVTAVERAQQDGGMAGRESGEMLDVRFDESAPLAAAQWLLLRDSAGDWSALINRARSGDLDVDRTEAAARAAESLVATYRQAPTHCPNCSAPLALPSARGVLSITCRYCGSTVAL